MFQPRFVKCAVPSVTGPATAIAATAGRWRTRSLEVGAQGIEERGKLSLQILPLLDIPGMWTARH